MQGRERAPFTGSRFPPVSLQNNRRAASSDCGLRFCFCAVSFLALVQQLVQASFFEYACVCV